LAGGANMFGDMLIPKLNLMSTYKISGRILLLPIHGQGIANITMGGYFFYKEGKELTCLKFIRAVNLKTSYTMENEIIKKKNGHEYIKVNAFNMKLIPGKSYINFENLFNGDKRLSIN